MSEIRGDQAEGLRRMLDRVGTRVITLASGRSGVGKTSVAVNLACVLAQRGIRVLLIDENRGDSNISAAFGLSPRYALEQVARDECTLEDVLIPARHGVTVLPAAGVFRAALHGELRAKMACIGKRFEVVLVDTPCGRAGVPEIFTGASHDTIVVSLAAPQSVTAAYALIKRLNSAGGQHRCHVLLNRVVHEENARVILSNFAGVARSHLQMPVESLGCIPRDESLCIGANGFRPAADAQPWPLSAARFRGIADVITAWPGAHAGLIDRFMQRVLAGSPPVLAPAGV